MGVPIGVDFGAVLAVAEAQGADTELIAEALPAVEAALIDALSGDGTDDFDEEGSDDQS